MLWKVLAASIPIYLVAAFSGCQGKSNHDHSGHDHGSAPGNVPPSVSALPIGNSHPGYCQVQGDELDVAEASSDPKLHSDFAGKRYLFCCEECKPLFDANAKKYLTTPPAPKKKAAGRS